MRRVRRTRTKGQAMQVFALLLGLGVIIGLLAIAFDGGSSLLQRRTMQNGAEAGAIGGVNYMGQHLAISCNPAPCHPTYFATNTELRTHIEGLVGANRGGTVGSPTYATTIEYHYISGHLPPVDECPSGPRRDLGYCPPPVDPEYPYVPEFVDGLAVTAMVNNPTTFAGAMPQASDSVRVSAIAAARIFPTCRPEGEPGKTLPMTRFRPAVEYELYDPDRGNSICHPFAFWTSQPDVGNSIKNVMSFNNATLREHNNVDEQMITGFDNRMGPSPTGSGLSYYDHAQLWRTLQTCMLEPCVNMFNAGLRATDPPPPQPPTSGDMANWIFWQWQGVISTTTTVWNNTANSMTEYPSTRENGANGSGARPGDWAEIIGISGSYGQNIQNPVHDLALTAADRIMFTASLPVNQGGLNWGPAVRRTIYVWGPEADNVLTGRVNNNDTAAQVWDTWDPLDPNRCNPGNNPTVSGWTDLTIDGQYNQNNNQPDYGVTNENCNGNGGPNNIERVNFTESYDFLFFANLQGNYGAVAAAGCPALPNDGSSAYGILPAPFVPEPPPGGGGCGGGWDPLGGAYGQQIDPNS